MDKVKINIMQEPSPDDEVVEYIIRRKGMKCTLDVICGGASSRHEINGDDFDSIKEICSRIFTESKTELGFTGVSEEDYQNIVASYNES